MIMVGERTVTYDFLNYLHEKYPLVTFNINVLGLDVSSILFDDFWKFNISEIRFPCSPKYFLGNIVGWNSYEEVFDRNVLDLERNNVMRNLLYPWMPVNCCLPVYVFYRLSETSRNTLVWKCKNETPSRLNVDSIVSWSNANSCIEQGKTSVTVYNLNSHHLIQCDDLTIDLLELMKKRLSVREIIVFMLTKYSEEQFDWSYYQEQIDQLYNLGFIEVENNN